MHARLTLLLTLAGLAGWGLHAAWMQWPLRLAGWQALAVAALVMLLLAAALATLLLAPLQALLRALQGAVLSWRDGDFSTSIAVTGLPETRQLLQLHHDLGAALRDQRQHLAQRELLLDTVVQNTPLALLLADAAGVVVYANIAARQLLAQGRSLTGLPLHGLMAQAAQAGQAPQALAALAALAALTSALQGDADQLFTVPGAADGSAGPGDPGGPAQGEESFLLSQRSLSLLGQPHRLVLLRRMTRELSRQEVASWKRVIRVISHELNNSLAPISSLAHSGAELARRGDVQRVAGVLASIAERSAHLHGFLSGYASVAKLPAPRWEVVDWAAFVAGLHSVCVFAVAGDLPAQPASFDAAQVEQALINLIKNAHESGSAPGDVSLQVSLQGAHWRLCVSDRGAGMTQAVMAQALLPFYSTKRSGSGLGLALAREIAEAHGGHITLTRRHHGGLRASLFLPCRAAATPNPPLQESPP